MALYPGRNDVLGWAGDRPHRGNGAKSLGQELAYSGAFAECQTEKVFRKVCFRGPTQAELGPGNAFENIVHSFEGCGSLRSVFAQVAAQCAGQ
jgi:hypothetical protein